MQDIIQKAWENRELLKDSQTVKTIEAVIEGLDKGEIRVAEPNENGEWIVHEWVKKAVILYFPTRKMETIEVGPFEFHDKIKLKTGYEELGVRVVPHAIARHGSFVAKGVIMMPSYVNIGAYVDSGTMVDTWATVGSCAQIGKNVHLSGGVGIGGSNTGMLSFSASTRLIMFSVKSVGSFGSIFSPSASCSSMSDCDI